MTKPAVPPQTAPEVVLDLKLKYCEAQATADCAHNNGNIQWQEIAGPGISFVQNYLYDRFNRLGSYSETGSGGAAETYGFDKFGNRWRPGAVGVPSSGDWYSNNKNRAVRRGRRRRSTTILRGIRSRSGQWG